MQATNELTLLEATAKRLQMSGEHKIQLANQLRAVIEEERGNHNRLTPQGRDKVRVTAAAQWKPCEIGCNKKHRINDPKFKDHFKTGKVTAMRRKSA